MDDVALYTEWGFMLALGHLVTRVTHEKHLKAYIGVDACACNLMRGIYGAYITLPYGQGKPLLWTTNTTWWAAGGTRQVRRGRMLPKIDIGDMLVIPTPAPTVTP
jgi:hypothetical protein